MEGTLRTALLSFLLFLLLMNYTSAITVDRILATVNDEIITQSDYNRFISKIGSVEQGEAVDENILKNLIEEKIILQEASNKGIDTNEEELKQSIKDIQEQNNLTSEEFERNLANESISFGEYKKFLKENVISLKLIDKEVNSKIIITDEDITDFYNMNMNLFKESQEKQKVKAIFLKLSDIPSLTEATDLQIKALRIYEAIKNGEPFDKMVNLYSDEPLKSRNGMLGEFEKGGLISSLDKKLSGMKEGEVSEPVWSKEGVYILMLLKNTKEKFAPIDRVKDQIYLILYERKKEEKYNEWMKELWGKSSVKIKYQ